jgi:hypothetical protein
MRVLKRILFLRGNSKKMKSSREELEANLHKDSTFRKIFSIEEVVLFTILFLIMIGIASVKLWDFKYISIPFELEIKNGDASSIVYGVTGGVLSLMGLLSIFVSINSQHRIEKARELSWILVDLPNEQDDNRVNISYNMSKNLRKYMTVTDGKDLFVLTVTKVSQWTIIFVCCVWSIYISLTTEKHFDAILLSIVNIFGIFILLCFYGILRNLTKIDFIGENPNSHTLLDSKQAKKFDVLTMYFVPHNLLFEIDNNELIVSLKVPMNNISIYLRRSYFPYEGSLVLKGEKQINLNESFEEFQKLNLKSKLVLARYPMPKEFDNVLWVEFITTIIVSTEEKSKSLTIKARYFIPVGAKNETDIKAMNIL